jgi:hypothetical protein
MNLYHFDTLASRYLLKAMSLKRSKEKAPSGIVNIAPSDLDVSKYNPLKLSINYDTFELRKTHPGVDSLSFRSMDSLAR